MVAVPFVLMDPAVAVKLADVCPAGMFTADGTVTLALLLERDMLTSADGAAVIVTVQVEVPGAFTVAGEQMRLLACTACTRLNGAVTFAPLHAAVTVASAFA
jgi:hypothetical protein